MLKIKYDNQIIQTISLFEQLTGAKVKDCIAHEHVLLFIVEENDIGKAIGKNGAHVRKIEHILKKKIRIIEYSPDLISFIRNIIYPIKAKEITQENSVVTIVSSDSKSRGLLIGRAASILRNNEKIAKRLFEIDEIKVV